MIIVFLNLILGNYFQIFKPERSGTIVNMGKYIIALALACLLVPTQADARAVCRDKEGLVKRLASEYGEYLTSSGLSNNGLLTEIFSSEAGTYTVVKIYPNYPKIGCLVETGKYYSIFDLNESKAKEGDKL